MWILKCVNGKIFRLSICKTYLIGRLSPDIDLVLTDKCISRQHAAITVTSKDMPTVSQQVDMPTQVSPAVTIIDKKSRHGTFIRNSHGVWEIITHTEERLLKEGDCIRFGAAVPLSDNVWTLNYVPLIITSSKLYVEETSVLNKNIAILGGHVIKAWTDKCEYLTMSKITLTVKAMCALAQGKPIVTPKFWQRYCDRLSENKTDPPDYQDFIPPLAEVTLQASPEAFFINKNRKGLFCGKCFVFGTHKRWKELGPLVTYAGGKAVAFEKCKLSIEELCQPHVIVMNYHCNPSQESQTLLVKEFHNATDAVKAKGRRAIPEQEIGFAILYCSIERYCNPDIVFGSSLLSNSNTSQSSRTKLDLSSVVLAYDTQELQTPQQSKSSVLTNIPASGKSTIRSSTVTDNMSTDDHTSAIDFTLTNPNVSCKKTSALLPIKEGQRLSAENIPSRGSSTKRLLDIQQGDQPVAKKPATFISPPGMVNDLTSRPSTSRVTSVDLELDDEDLFDFPSERKSRPSRVEEGDEDGEFDFPNKSQTETQKKRPTKINETGDADLFATMDSSTRRSSFVGLKGDDDMFRTVESETSVQEEEPIRWREKHAPSVRAKALQQLSSKRKMNVDMDQARETSKKKAPSAQPVAHENSRETTVLYSLIGFLNTTRIKEEEDVITDLSDSITSAVIVEEMPLIVKRPMQDLIVSSNTTGSTITNFKKFRKIPHLVKQILPQIIGGNDLYLDKDSIGDNWGQNHRATAACKSDDDDRNSNDWDFQA